MMEKHSRKITLALLAMLLLVTAACGSADVVPPTALPGATEVLAEAPGPTATSRPTAPPEPSATPAPTAPAEPTATPAPTETPAPATTPDITADFVAFEHTTFTLRLPEDWYSDAAFGLGFFATDAGLQDTWYSEAGPVVPEGALVVVLVGTRGDLGIGAEDSASDAMVDRTSETSEGCVAIEDPVKTTINGQDGTTGLWACTSAEGLSTTLLSAIILSEDRAASLTGIVAAESEAELLAIVRAIIDSFQFVEN